MPPASFAEGIDVYDGDWKKDDELEKCIKYSLKDRRKARMITAQNARALDPTGVEGQPGMKMSDRRTADFKRSRGRTFAERIHQGLPIDRRNRSCQIPHSPIHTRAR